MGQGIISVSKVLFDNDTAQPQTLEQWHTLLLLPEEYRVLEVRSVVGYPLWEVAVENDAIPLIEDGLPDVLLIMHRDHDPESNTSTVGLLEIAVSKPAYNVIWQKGQA